MNRSIIDIIKERTSCRTFDREHIIESQKRELLNKFISKFGQGPFGGQLRFKLIDVSLDDPVNLKNFGTYGFIKDAQSFLVGAVSKSRYDLEDFGYIFEQIILFATRMGLGTCWLGGTFKRSGFSQDMKLGKREFVPAISPIGYSLGERRLIDKTIRWIVGSQKRKSWESLFFLGDFSTPLDRNMMGGYEIVLDMLRLAPSSSNRQPWRIVRDTNRNVFHFFTKRTSTYQYPIKHFVSIDLQRIDMGIAMCHFDSVVNEMQLRGSWKFLDPKIDLVPKDATYLVSWVED